MLTQLIDMYAQPSWEHPLGTDSNGMDVMTRLMYGGRISLMVGFVVILIEMVIGIIIGGISGYFGGWVDTLLMRFLDLFNCIPFWPMVIIAGSIMDTMEIDPYARVFLLMVILGVLSWPGIARVVRGQILALREQDFMVATEATGIRISKRIFRHLVPNVMPLLIAQANAGPWLDNHYRGYAFLPWPGHQVSAGFLGQHNQCSYQLVRYDQLLVHMDTGRFPDTAYRSGIQLRGRRPARRV